MIPDGADTDLRPGFIRRIRRRLVQTRPSLREVVIGSPLWGLTMAASAIATLYLRNGAETSRLFEIFLLFFAGGMIAWPCSLAFARAAVFEHRRETRFAAFFFCLTVCTIALTAFLFAMDYRQFYTRWHAAPGTLIWAYQFVFTSLAAAYQFVVMGIRLYMPFGFAALVLASLWLAWQIPGQRR